MKLFGRNIGRPYTSEYEDELERVLEAVTFVPEHWAPFDSIFQETAWQTNYSDIFEELCIINERVMLDD